VLDCFMRVFRTACTHMVKFEEIRADNRTMSKERIGHLNTNFTYIIMGKGLRPAGHALPRILRVLYESR
jgi:hypothetical protein